MIHQDGVAQTATAQNQGALVIPDITAAEPSSDCLLVVVFAAEGSGIQSPLEASVTYGGREMSAAAQSSNAQYGGVWIYTLSNPESGLDVEISFQDLVLDDLAGAASVFRGIDSNRAIGFTEGVLSSSQHTIAAPPASAKSRFLTAMVSGIGEENRFAESDMVAALKSRDMAMNLAISDSPVDGGDFEIHFGDGNSRNAIAVMELLPAADVLRVDRICFKETIRPVAENTTSEDGTPIKGDYGVLTMGADGSYDYQPNPDVVDFLPTKDGLNDVFIYGLSNGTESSLSVPVHNPSEEFGDVTPGSDDPGDLVVTGIRFEGGGYLPVAKFTTGDDGTSIKGNYGTLTIGADGSYSYLTDKEAVRAVSPLDPVREVFAYLLSDESEHPLPIDVEPGGAETKPIEAEERIFAITEITAGSGETLPVANGSTADVNGTTITGSYGMLTIGADGSYDYDVNQGLSGPLPESPKDVFSYTISDGVTAEKSELIIAVTVPEVGSPEISEEVIEEPNHTDEELAEVPAAFGAEVPSEETAAALESLVYEVEFDTEIDQLDMGDFEVFGSPGVSIASLTKIRPGRYELTIEGADLTKYSEDIGIRYLGIEEENAPAGEATESEREIPRFPPRLTMISSGAARAYSDFGPAQSNTKIEVSKLGTPVVDIVSPANKLVTLTEMEIPTIITATPERRAVPGKIPVPLEIIAKLFRNQDDKRFFGGIRVSEEDPGENGITYFPYFAGSASNTATMKITIQNRLGVEEGSLTVVADESGYWTASPEIVLEQNQYTITIEEFPSTWEGQSPPTRFITAYFSGGIPGDPDKVPLLIPGQIIGEIITGQSLEDLINDTTNQSSSLRP